MIVLDRAYRAGFFRNRVRDKGHFPYKTSCICDGIIKRYHPKSLMDVGCGIGDLIEFFLDNGIDACGIEGTKNCLEYLRFPADRLTVADLRLPLGLEKKFDLALSLEVAEHIEEEYADVFCDNLISLSDTVIMTAAPPNQGGNYHVNCQEKEYWIDKFGKRGFVPKWDDMAWFADAWMMLSWKRATRVYVVNLMIFKRGKYEIF